jgi:hypothetical protein
MLYSMSSSTGMPVGQQLCACDTKTPTLLSSHQPCAGISVVDKYTIMVDDSNHNGTHAWTNTTTRMTHGHAEAQRLFRELGKELGYKTARRFTSATPTDGVWMRPIGFGPMKEIPIAAIEVAVSEGRKSWRGSIATLELVSPAIGILLLQDEEITRRLLRTGVRESSVMVQIARTLELISEDASRSRQRIEVMVMGQLRYQHRVYAERRLSA